MITEIKHGLERIKEKYTRAPISAIFIDSHELINVQEELYAQAVEKLDIGKNISDDIKKIIHNPPLINYSDLNHSWDKFTNRNMYNFYSLNIESILLDSDKWWYRAYVSGDGRYLSSKSYAFRNDKNIICDEEKTYIINYVPNHSGTHINYICTSSDYATSNLLAANSDMRKKNYFNIEYILDDFLASGDTFKQKLDLRKMFVLYINVGSLSKKKLSYNAELWYGLGSLNDEILFDKQYLFE